MISVWSDTSSLPAFKRLEKSISTDVLIIGGGITGILCAYMLKNEGVDCVIAEADTLCCGTTKNTTAKITSQHGFIYDRLIREFGEGKARLYLKANEKALDRYRTLCTNIECDFEEKDSYVYSRDDKEKVRKEYDALCRLGFNAHIESDLPLPLKIAGAIKFPCQAQFSPLKFLSFITSGLQIYEHTSVRKLLYKTAYTDFGEINAKRIIIASHFPFINSHGSYFLKMYQHRSYVIALENAAQVNGMYVDEDKKGLSFRNYENLLLVGGGGGRTGKKCGGYRELESFAQLCYPGSKIKYRWATQDCMTLDGIPYIGNYSLLTDDIYVATGFNKWGMTSSMISADLLTDMLTGKKNVYEDLFSPSRTILRPQLAVNIFDSVTGLLTPTSPRCSHLGCALKWNKAERTWDCGCHGSRFDEHGKLADGPAMKNLKRK